MIIQERIYQSEAVDSVFDYFATNNGNPLIALPTGSGKAIVIALFLKRVFKQWPRQKILVLTHVKELIEQNYTKLLDVWPTAPAGIYSAGLNRRDTVNNIIFGGIASVINATKQFGRVNLIIIDEAHLVSPKTDTLYAKFIAELKEANAQLKVLGLTATPFRLGQGMLTDPGGLFTDICYDMTSFQAFNKLVDDGYLCTLVTKKPAVMLDTSKLHMQAGDYNQKEMALAFSLQAVTKVAVDDILLKGSDRQHILVFASSIEHAEEICELFSFRGVEAAMVHAKTPSSQRNTILEDFKAGKVRVLVNMGVLTTGFDFPALDLIALLRATASPVLWVQICGRGTRPSPGKANCLVLDYGGNAERLGPINDPVIPKKKGKGGGTAPIKLCLECATYNHISARICSECGTEFIFEVKIDLHASTAELIKTTAPIVEDFTVNHCTYSAHSKIGRPDSLKVTYHCGCRFFAEYVCFAHHGLAQTRAASWWRLRSDLPVPETAAEALDLLQKVTIKVAGSLRIIVNTKWPEILSCTFNETMQQEVEQ